MRPDVDILRLYAIERRLTVRHRRGFERVAKSGLRPRGTFSILTFKNDASLQGKGIGPALLKDALLRAALAADTIGARAVLVHAKDDRAKGFYEHFNFEPSPSDPYHLLLITKDLMRIVGK
jgi:GNAT superfamily N-acetyltransferase